MTATFPRLGVRAITAIAGTAGTAAALVGGVALGGTAASAAPAPNASVFVDTLGMHYSGFDAPNAITVRSSGARFIVTDTAPITAGAGCATFAPGGRLFGVTCTALTASNGALRPFFVFAGKGDDVVTNLAAAAMTADGGQGNDVLNGGALGDKLLDAFGGDTLRGNGGSDSLLTTLSNDGLPDRLEGGDGDDDLKGGDAKDTLLGGAGSDLLFGGLGGDYLDAGGGANDVVSYFDTVHKGKRIVASLDGITVANDGAQEIGGPSEGDTIAGSPDILVGGSGKNVLFGDSADNHLIGHEADDILIGGKGADFLEGFGGNDQLASNQMFGVPVADGRIDTLDGGDGTADYCRVPFVAVEADITKGCEIINQD
ncbi:MAG TPA: hypothetical protein VFU35_13430 [Jatrophihabitans sp.]|nr:hypothetical protein [Jatrophihabitans sp.]